MRTLTRTAVAVLGSAVLGLGVVAAPATAAPGDAITLELANDTYTAGSWGDGVEYTVNNVPDGVDEITFALGTPFSPVGEPLTVQAEDGVATGTINPPAEQSPVAGVQYIASARYEYVDENDEQQFVTDAVDLTVVEGASVTGPEEATVAELAAGVDLELSGFSTAGEVDGDIQFLNEDTWETVGPVAGNVGSDGTGTLRVQITGATAGDQFRVTISSADSSVTHFIRAIAGGPSVDDEQESEEAPGAPVRPTRVDTGA